MAGFPKAKFILTIHEYLAICMRDEKCFGEITTVYAGSKTI